MRDTEELQSALLSLMDQKDISTILYTCREHYAIAIKDVEKHGVDQFAITLILQERKISYGLCNFLDDMIYSYLNKETERIYLDLHDLIQEFVSPARFYFTPPSKLAHKGKSEAIHGLQKRVELLDKMIKKHEEVENDGN